MRISISAKHGPLSESVQQTIHQKVEKLPRYFDRTTGAEVLVDLKNADQPKVEIKVSAEETNDFFAADSATNVLAALDSVLAVVQDFRYEEAICVATETGFVEEHFVRGRLPDGSALELAACVVAEIEEGKVTELREYVDGNAAAGLLAALSSG